MPWSHKRFSAHYTSQLLLALIIGSLAGLGAVAFRELIIIGQEVLWPGGPPLAEQMIHAHWWWRILVPACLGLLIGPVVTYLAPEVRGPGVPEVMESLALRRGRIRHRVTIMKTIVTAGLISGGASVGREGPIVQIGSSIGSSLTQILGLGRDFRRLAVACGAAAGIAATFQAPMAGTLFAVEILLFDLEVTFLSHIVVAAVTGTVIARLVWGETPVFRVPVFTLGHPAELALYLILGLLAGLVSLLLMMMVFGLPGLWKKLSVPDWLSPCLGGVFVGMLGLYWPWALGVGYETIGRALNDDITLVFAFSLLFAKLLATGLCIGTGMSGGIFAPSLFLGAMLGGLVGMTAGRIWPEAGLLPAHYALVGMGAVVSGTTLAPITAILTVFEFTYSYEVILPLMVSCIASLAVVRLLHGYSAYETKLLQKGVNIVKGHEVNILRGMKIKDHMSTDARFLHTDTPFFEISSAMEESAFPHFLVLDSQERLAGVLTLRDLRWHLAHPDQFDHATTAESLMSRDVVTVYDDDDLETAFHIFSHHNFSFLPVVTRENPKRVIGQLKKTELLAAYEQFVLKDNIIPPLGWVCPIPEKEKDP